MKPTFIPSRSNRGFALVVTLTLMVLLSILAVGLLNISAVVLRSSAQAQPQIVARANARLALGLAIAELQKNLGPDQRISAPATVISATANPGITGAWESWTPNPDGGNDYTKRRTARKSTPVADGEFLGWLVSSQSGSPPDDPTSPPDTKTGVDMLSGVNGNDGVKLPAVKVGKNGGMAWMVMDEGVKARFNLPDEKAPALAGNSRLRSPSRNAVEKIPGLEQLKTASGNSVKLVSNRQGEILTGTGTMKNFVHDVTPYSASVMSNVSAGGLKADLTRAFEETDLPAELSALRVYSQNATPLAPADPYMRSLSEYYRLYKDFSDPTTPIGSRAPKGYSAYTGTAPNLTANLQPGDGMVLTPIVSKVQIVFSLIAREAHDHWSNTIPGRTGDSQRKYMVYMIYTPVVTVSNPYDVPLTVTNLKTTFRNIPVSFRLFRNNTAQTNSMAPLSRLHARGVTSATDEDPFSVTLTEVAGGSGGTVTLRPGEARIFGANHSPNAVWGSMTNYLWLSTQTSRTLDIRSGSGWDFRTGFIVDWLAPANAGRTPDNFNLGVFGIRATDTVDVACAPMMPPGSNGNFSIEVQADLPGQSPGTPTRIGYYNYRYGTEGRLKEILEKGQNPALGEVTYPFRREVPWSWGQLYQPNVESTKVKDWTGPKEFAVFTLADRTSQDSQYPGKPGKHSSFVHHALDMDATSTSPGKLPMEMSLLPIKSSGGAGTTGSIDADGFDRSYYFSGNRSLTGTPTFASYQLPLKPLTNIADLRHANLASSGNLPLATYTVGESHAPAMIPADKARLASTSALDHAWLANSRLWDGYYFSAITDSAEATAFFNSSPLSYNPRFVPFIPTGSTKENSVTEATSATGWKTTPARQLQLGAFNVNSTSIEAWKAVLSAHAGAEIPVFDPITLAESKGVSEELPILRTIRSAAASIDADNSNSTRWSGYRNLEKDQVTKLATEIVRLVKAKGPFLSLGDFVNRRLVSESNPDSLGGILETAIKDAGINNIPAGPVTRSITKDQASAYGFENTTAAAGDTEEGSRANISQGDLLSMIGSNLTVRSDTFVVRAYGEARDPAGTNVIAKAWCEAVVQRVPSYVDPTDKAEVFIGTLNPTGTGTSALSATNQQFGRRFEIVSFRWLSASDI